MDNKINRVLDVIKKVHGKDSVTLYDEKNIISGIDVIPTSSLSLDSALGVGGIPRGRIVEIYGPESSGKTTLTLEIIREAQRLNILSLFIDMEHALDVKYAKKIGINMQDLLLSQPDSGDIAMEVLDTALMTKDVGLIVVDSVPALITQAEIDGKITDKHYAPQARLMSQSLRKIVPKAEKYNCCIIFINQIREKVGIVFGNPEITTGGKALRFYASVRMRISSTKGKTKSSGNIIHNDVKVKVEKNKVASPFREAKFIIKFGVGIDSEKELLDIALGTKIIKYSDSKKCHYIETPQGIKRLPKTETELYNMLHTNDKLFNSLNKLVRKKLGL